MDAEIKKKKKRKMCLTEIYMAKIVQLADAGWCNALKAGSWAVEIGQELARDSGITRHLHLEIVSSLGGRATRDQGSRRWGTSTRCFANRYRVL